MTDKIQQAVSLAVSAYGSNFGWDLVYFPPENQLYLNVPVSTGYQEQYVMNTITRAWSNYTGWPANCWELFDDAPYFGGNGVVCHAWNGLKDNTSNIVASGLQAFSPFRTSGLLKRFTLAKPIFRAQGPFSVGVAINVDFDTNDNTPVVPASQNFSLGVWDITTWDNCIWAALSIVQGWLGINGIGNYAAPYVKISSPGVDVRWESTTIVYEKGAIL